MDQHLWMRCRQIGDRRVLRGQIGAEAVSPWRTCLNQHQPCDILSERHNYSSLAFKRVALGVVFAFAFRISLQL